MRSKAYLDSARRSCKSIGNTQHVEDPWLDSDVELADRMFLAWLRMKCSASNIKRYMVCTASLEQPEQP